MTPRINVLYSNVLGIFKEGKFVEDTSSRFSYFIENKFTVHYSYFPLIFYILFILRVHFHSLHRQFLNEWK